MAMEELQILIEQMVSDISSQAAGVDEIRLQKFMEWLHAHSSRVKAANQTGDEVTGPGEENVHDRLRNGLRGWFESLSLQGLLWEYHLLLNEIIWWRNLDPLSLAQILESEGRK